MMLIPWRKTERWNCLKCGRCCSHFYVPLSEREKNTLIYEFGKRVVTLKGGQWRLKRIDGKCIFLSPDGLCRIHKSKPKSCDLFPFYVFENPRHNLSGEKAEYWNDGTCYFVYLHKFCRGLGEGAPIRDFLPDVLMRYKQKELSGYFCQESTTTP